ncbi:MAG: 4'-phosphopantetheinyl transferase superfamily protein [Nitrospira sp.]|nr:4'-phosphopantetheinyl transferase superfamily protein [Nitrospira sp.]MBH0196715.1 4'-phosphopantetheinyl transferase superfamily protein [Nitrospira sp.]
MGKASVTFQRVPFETDGIWRSPITIDCDDVQVWGVLLEITDSELPRAGSVLSHDERGRAERLISDEHRRQSIATHAMLRAILSRYCGAVPEDLAIRRTPDGKPVLSDYPSIRFNLTHSHGRAIIVVARDREVGVDLEQVRREIDVGGLAKRFLSERDLTFIEHGDPAQRHERFLKAWVAREAVFKADGRGITFPLHRDYLELTGDGTTGCLVLGGPASDEKKRPVRFLSLDPGWIGAVAAEGTDWTVTVCNWSESNINRGI